MKALKNFLKRVEATKTPRRIAVVGDMMIDEYYSVSVNRISPEFPIPVMQSVEDKPVFVVPGGAGNVCMQFKHFPVNVSLFSFIDSYSGKILRDNLISTDFCVNLDSGKVPLKQRYYHKEFPLCRNDIEQVNYGLSEAELKSKQIELFNNFQSAHAPDVVIFSDYHKGVFVGESTQWSSYEKAITIVDPKKGPANRWKGCSILKPNAKEAKELTGTDNWEEACDILARATDCTAVVITQAGDGVVGKVLDREFCYHPQKTTPTDSVIGAGDCFMAFLAMCLSYQMDIIEAVEVAFEAGRLYVQNKHNAPVSQDILRKISDPYGYKYFLPQVREGKWVLTNGCFDILHAGHIELLRYARSLGDKLIVAVNSDESIKNLKGLDRPIIPLEQRMKILSALDCVDCVVAFDEPTPYNIIKSIMPEIIVKGPDYKIEDVVGHDLAQVVIWRPKQVYSSSDIIRRCKNC